jgi:hypothetical protein
MARPKDIGLEHAWRLRLRRQATGGLSIPEFCSREGVSPASFDAWRRRLAASPAVAPAEPPLFVPIPLEPGPRREHTPAGHGFEIELPHRVLLRCEAAPDPEWLGRVVAALARPATRGDAP